MSLITDLPELITQLTNALEARRDLLLDTDHIKALRLFNGFYEGYPGLVVDLYAQTLLLSAQEAPQTVMDRVQEHLLEQLPWVNCVLQKMRSENNTTLRRGVVTYGNQPAQKVRENACWYAVNLTMNQDASLYLDTRNLRQWLFDHADGWKLLNTFAYTGSLGLAALVGGASQVVQVDINKNFLSLAQQSCALNKLSTTKMELLATDFFSAVAFFKRRGQLFNCVIADPPFFSTTAKGTVNLVDQGVRVINKLRPLVQDGGRLITINNALFLSGEDYQCSLEQLCQDGYLEIETFIDVPVDFTGYPQTIVSHPPVNPAPFNHPTKIAILKVHRKA